MAMAARVAAFWLFTFGVTGQPAWKQMTSLGSGEAPRDEQSLVFAEADKAVLAFGGISLWPTSSIVLFGDLWKYSVAANNWTKLPSSEHRPASRKGQAAAFSQRDRAFYVFGGQTYADQGDGVKLINDLWKYSLASNSWQQLATPAGQSPAPRVQHSMAFSEQDNALYVFGGFLGHDEAGDLWKYSVTSNSWEQLVPSGSAPSAREMTAMVYSELDRALFMFGGNAGTAWFPQELWKYSVEANSWQQLRPDGSAISGGSAAFLQADRQVIFFGDNGLFQYSVAANSWRQLLPAGSPPYHPTGPVALSQSDRTLFLFATDKMGLQSEFWKITGLHEGQDQSRTANVATNYI